MIINIVIASLDSFSYLRIMKDAIFIKANVASSKNSKQWTGKFLVNSKTTQNYIKETKQQYIDLKDDFLEMTKDADLPLRVAFKFIRGSKHKFDYVNPMQTVLDLMVKNGWIEDDNADVIIPIFEPYEYSKDNPGVYIKLIE